MQYSGAESPFNSPSPPSHTMRAMRLCDGLGSPNTACAITSNNSDVTTKGIHLLLQKSKTSLGYRYLN